MLFQGGGRAGAWVVGSVGRSSLLAMLLDMCRPASSASAYEQKQEHFLFPLVSPRPIPLPPAACDAALLPLLQSAPIVRVAVEPANPADMPALEAGLRLLHRADPMVLVEVQEGGEHVLCAAGERACMRRC